MTITIGMLTKLLIRIPPEADTGNTLMNMMICLEILVIRVSHHINRGVDLTDIESTKVPIPQGSIHPTNVNERPMNGMTINCLHLLTRLKGKPFRTFFIIS